MNTLLDFFQTAGFFLLALVVRLVLAAAVVVVLSLPILAVLYAWRAGRRVWEKSIGLAPVDGLELAGVFRYSPGHAWLAERRNGTLRVGLDDLAQRLLPGVSVISLPHPGARLDAGQPAVTIAAGSHLTTLPAPVGGVVTAVNEAVTRDPHLMHRSPYGRGWLYAVTPAADTFRKLPTGEAARKWFHAENVRLSHFVEGELGLAAADGGELTAPAMALLPEEKYRSLLASFLMKA